MGERAKSTQCIRPHIIFCSFIPYKVLITIYTAFHIMPSPCHTIQSSFSLYWDSSQDAKPLHNLQSHFTLYRASFTPYRDPLRYKELLHTLYRAPFTPFRAPSHYKELLHNMQTLYRVSTQYRKSFHIIQSPLRTVQVRAGPGYIILEHCTMLLHTFTNLLTLHSSSILFQRASTHDSFFTSYARYIATQWLWPAVRPSPCILLCCQKQGIHRNLMAYKETVPKLLYVIQNSFTLIQSSFTLYLAPSYIPSSFTMSGKL